MTNKRERERLVFVVEDEPPTSAEERFALRLKALRQAKGLTQAELAERMGEHGFTWHQTTVAKTERADRPLRLNEVEALAQALGVMVVDLVADRGPAPPDGRAAPAARRLDAAERLYNEVLATTYDAARSYGKLQGEATALREFIEQQQPRLDELERQVHAARDEYWQAVGDGSDG